jgi:hypothetical protein
MAFSDTYRESIQSKHLSNVGFTSTAKGASNESFALKNPHQILANQIPAIDVVATYGPLVADGIAAGLVEKHTIKLTADPTVNGNKAWVGYESDCIETGHSARGAIRIDMWMRYAETQYKLRVFADNGAGTGPNYSSEILASETAFNWEYDASAGTVYFDADPTGLGYTGPLWGEIYKYTGEFLSDKIDTTVSGGGKSFLYMTDGVNIAEAESSGDTLTFQAAGGLNVTVDSVGKIVTISGAASIQHADVDMTYNSGVWEYDGDFATVPADIEVYYNGVKSKDSVDYYTAAVTAGVLQVTFTFDTYSDDWVNVEWNSTYAATGGLKVWVEKLANYTALPYDRIVVNTQAVAAYAIKLPASPVFGETVSIFDGGGNCSTVNVTIDRNGKPIMGLAQDLLIDVDNASFELVYYNDTYGWRIVE